MTGVQGFGPGAASGRAEPSPADPAPRTALPLREGRPVHLEAHLERLSVGARALGLPCLWLGGLTAELESWLSRVEPRGDAALRLVLHPAREVLVARIEAMPVHPDPYRLVLLPHPLASRRQDPLATHKGACGPWWQATLAEAGRLGAADALLCWPDGGVAETAIAAVVLEGGGVLKLPPSEGRVESLAERLDLPAWAKRRQLPIVRGAFGAEEARRGRIWCLNALRGIWPAALL